MTLLQPSLHKDVSLLALNHTATVIDFQILLILYSALRIKTTASGPTTAACLQIVQRLEKTFDLA